MSVFLDIKKLLIFGEKLLMSAVTDFKEGDLFTAHPLASPKMPILNRLNISVTEK